MEANDTNSLPTPIPNTFLLPEAQNHFDQHPAQTLVSTDAWGNEYIRAVGSKTPETNPKYLQTLQQIHQLWQSTLEGDDKQRQFLETIMTPQEIDRLNQSIDTLAQYPELVHKKFNVLNPWEIAQEGGPEKKAQAITKVHKTSMESFKNTAAFQRIVEISDKIQHKQDLGQDDLIFLDALAIARTETLIRIEEYPAPLRITPLTKKYILANATERLLARDLVPHQAFSQHQSRFQTFANTMRQQGIDMPDWFNGYVGNEFSFSMVTAGCKRLANPGFGIWFTQRMASDPLYFAAVIDHERVHDMQTAFESEGSGRIYPKPGFRSYEAATEAMSLLIRNNGDAQAALRENATEFRTNYATAVHQLLTILVEINTFSGDPSLATKLMTLNLKNISQVRLLYHVQEWYNQNLAQQNGSTFEQRMSPFDDKKQVRHSSIEEIPPEKIPFTNTMQAVQQAQVGDFDTDQAQPWEIENFQKQKEHLQKYPQALIIRSENSIKEQLADKLFEDPEISNEFIRYLHHYYSRFTTNLEKTLKQVTQETKQ